MKEDLKKLIEQMTGEIAVHYGVAVKNDDPLFIAIACMWLHDEKRRREWNEAAQEATEIVRAEARTKMETVSKAMTEFHNDYSGSLKKSSDEFTELLAKITQYSEDHLKEAANNAAAEAVGIAIKDINNKNRQVIQPLIIASGISAIMSFILAVVVCAMLLQ